MEALEKPEELCTCFDTPRPAFLGPVVGDSSVAFNDRRLQPLSLTRKKLAICDTEGET